MRRFLRVLGVVVCVAGMVQSASAGSDVTLFRLYMLDGSVLTSYGEFARVDDSVVFSMAIGGNPDQPRIQVTQVKAALVDWQRKDLEALAEANREAYEGIKALAERRKQMLEETLAQWQDALKDSLGEDALAKQSEAAQRGVQRAIENFRELSELEAQTRLKAWKVVQDRMQENMGSLQKLLQPK